MSPATAAHQPEPWSYLTTGLSVSVSSAIVKAAARDTTATRCAIGAEIWKADAPATTRAKVARFDIEIAVWVFGEIRCSREQKIGPASLVSLYPTADVRSSHTMSEPGWVEPDDYSSGEEPPLAFPIPLVIAVPGLVAVLIGCAVGCWCLRRWQQRRRINRIWQQHIASVTSGGGAVNYAWPQGGAAARFLDSRNDDSNRAQSPLPALQTPTR